MIFLKKLTIAASLFVLLYSNSWANACGTLSYSMNEASAHLNNAVKNDDIQNMKLHVHRARNALNNATIEAGNCGCNTTYVDLSNALISINHAKNSDELEEISSYVNRAIHFFNNAAIKMDCPQ